MDTKPFFQAALIGLSIAAPVGQIGVLAIQRTLQQGPRAGIATGFGAALADGAYGAVGAFGVAAVVERLVAAGPWLQGGGAALLLAMAWRTARAPAQPASRQVPGSADLIAQFAGTFVLTLANPMTILSFVAVFGALSGGTGAAASPWTLVLGVTAGSALWWPVLAGLVGAVRDRFDTRWMRRVNLGSAAVLGGFAAWQLAFLFRPA